MLPAAGRLAHRRSVATPATTGSRGLTAPGRCRRVPLQDGQEPRPCRDSGALLLHPLPRQTSRPHRGQTDGGACRGTGGGGGLLRRGDRRHRRRAHRESCRGRRRTPGDDRDVPQRHRPRRGSGPRHARGRRAQRPGGRARAAPGEPPAPCGLPARQPAGADGDARAPGDGGGPRQPERRQGRVRRDRAGAVLLARADPIPPQRGRGRCPAARRAVRLPEARVARVRGVGGDRPRARRGTGAAPRSRPWHGALRARRRGRLRRGRRSRRHPARRGCSRGARAPRYRAPGPGLRRRRITHRRRARASLFAPDARCRAVFSRCPVPGARCSVPKGGG